MLISVKVNGKVIYDIHRDNPEKLEAHNLTLIKELSEEMEEGTQPAKIESAL